MIAAALFASSGCARNAYLELTIELPADAQGRYAVTQVMAGSTGFEVDWGGDNPIAPVKLIDAAQTQRMSIEGDTDNESSEIRVKIRYCKNANCTELGDDKAPAVGLQIKRAFYIGKRTSFTWKAADTAIPCDTCPATIHVAEKCAISGCRGGAPTSNNCTGDKHFCEVD